MPSTCVVNADDLMTIPKDLLHERITVLTRSKIDSVATAIRFALDLDR
jgi:mRNA-degrading endonuclease toxin of MazEF toxin-antitoxin module